MSRVVQGSLVSPANKRGERTLSPPNYLLGSTRKAVVSTFSMATPFRGSRRGRNSPGNAARGARHSLRSTAPRDSDRKWIDARVWHQSVEAAMIYTPGKQNNIHTSRPAENSMGYIYPLLLLLLLCLVIM